MTFNPRGGVSLALPTTDCALACSEPPRDYRNIKHALDDAVDRLPVPAGSPACSFSPAAGWNKIPRLQGSGGLDTEQTRIRLPSTPTKNSFPRIVPGSAPPSTGTVVKRHEAGFGRPRLSGCPASHKATTGSSDAKSKHRTRPIAKLNSSKPIPEWRLHHLRRCTATGMAEDLKKVPTRTSLEPRLRTSVGGTKAGVSGHLQQRRPAPGGGRRPPLEHWAVHVDGIVDGSPAKVVSIGKRSGR